MKKKRKKKLNQPYKYWQKKSIDLIKWPKKVKHNRLPSVHRMHLGKAEAYHLMCCKKPKSQIKVHPSEENVFNHKRAKIYR